MLPLHLQSSPYFETVRTRLRSAGFTEKAICSRLGIAELGQISVNPEKHALPEVHDEISLLTSLFLLGGAVNRQELEHALSSEVVSAMANLGLAIADSAHADCLRSPVALYPAGPIFIVSDSWVSQPGKAFEPSDDFVYPVFTPNTMEFIANVPLTPCENFVELCGGAGPMAVIAAPYSRHVWTSDITERSMQTAEFNRLLNGIENLTSVKGDCYGGLEGLQFDRIVAHPPYMPVAQSAQIFYDGGEDGEHVTRRIVEGLPTYLRPGGRFYCLAQGSDRKGATVQQRVRGWLGESQADFDVAVVERRAIDPREASMTYAMKSKGGHPAMSLMRETFAKLGVESLCHGWIIVQRRKDDREVFTVRRKSDLQNERDQIEWMLNWETYAAGPSAFEDLLSMVPTANPAVELRSVHRLKDGELVPEQMVLHVERPFATDFRIEPWMSYLITLCNGKQTVRELWEACKVHNFIHPETPALEFARLIATLISGGYVEIPSFRPPVPQTESESPATAPEV